MAKFCLNSELLYKVENSQSRFSSHALLKIVKMPQLKLQSSVNKIVESVFDSFW